MKKFFLPVLFIFWSSLGYAQKSIKDSVINVIILSPSFAFQIPGGDMAKEFGDNANAGGSFEFKTKTNWIFGLDGNFIFGNDIHEPNLFSGISTPQGYILGTDGTFADVRTFERGYQFTLKAGKIIPKWGPNKNSGILLTGGAGFLQHKIRIETPGNDVPQLSGDYKDGYDMRTNGLAITEFAGYQYLSNRNLLNFFAGFEFVQAFTQERRTYNFDTMAPNNTKRFDTLSGIRVGWIFTIYKRKPNEFYIN